MGAMDALTSLVGQTLVQLRELASKLGVGGYSAMAKSELLTAVSEAMSPGTEVGLASVPTPVAEVTTHVVFLPRDPQWAYAFWEISSADRERATAAGAQQLCLRVADVTGLPGGTVHPHALQEVVVDAQGHEWFLPMPLSDRDYRVELGYRLAHGGWLSLAISSIARVPALGPSDVIADTFTAFSFEAPITPESIPQSSAGVTHEQFYQLSTTASPLLRRTGSEWLHELDQGSDDRDLGNASGAGLWLSGRTESGAGPVRQRSFWLVADAELIVYGATDPSASLFIGDEQIPLQADGTFRVHVPFKDGEQLYPIRAIAADGEQQRSIRLEFERRTPHAHVNTREAALAEWF